MASKFLRKSFFLVFTKNQNSYSLVLNYEMVLDWYSEATREVTTNETAFNLGITLSPKISEVVGVTYFKLFKI